MQSLIVVWLVLATITYTANGLPRKEQDIADIQEDILEDLRDADEAIGEIENKYAADGVATDDVDDVDDEINELMDGRNDANADDDEIYTDDNKKLQKRAAWRFVIILQHHKRFI